MSNVPSRIVSTKHCISVYRSWGGGCYGVQKDLLKSVDQIERSTEGKLENSSHNDLATHLGSGVVLLKALHRQSMEACIPTGPLYTLEPRPP